MNDPTHEKAPAGEHGARKELAGSKVESARQSVKSSRKAICKSVQDLRDVMDEWDAFQRERKSLP